MNRGVLVLVLCGVMSVCCAWGIENHELEAARGVIARQVPECGIAQGLVRLEGLSEVEGKPVYETEVREGVLIVRGSSGVSLCHGFYEWMKSKGMGMITWSGRRVVWRVPVGNEAPKRVVAPVPYFYYLNVVSYGYTVAYWGAERWRQEIDWMALHGINMPLALAGAEAIATRVWKKLGFTQREIDDFYVGPAHLPWQRMGNIVNHDGALPEAWHKEQIALEKYMLREMRSLGMHPICPAFAGFVPKEMKRLHPEAVLHECGWGGWAKKHHAYLLASSEPMFQEIQKMYLQEWEKEFGKSKYYLVDMFNEMELPHTSSAEELHAMLTAIGENTYLSLKQVGHDVVWVMQGWMLGYQRNIWNAGTLAALGSKVPRGSLLILDLAVDYNKTFWRNGVNWEHFNGFGGHDWVYSNVPNMGGKTAWTGVLEHYANGHVTAVQSSHAPQLKGIGVAMEGFENNEVVYELITDRAWHTDNINLQEYLKSYCSNRYGSCPEGIAEAWGLLCKSCYSNLKDHPQFSWQLAPGTRGGSVQYSPQFQRAVELYLANAPQEPNQLYANDLIELVVQLAGMKTQEEGGRLIESLQVGDKKAAQESWARFRALMLGMDGLLAAHSTLNLRRWLEWARKMAKGDKALENRYMQNAKRLVTIWGPPVNDYSCRIWHGLVGGYYLPRWENWYKCRLDGKPANMAEFDSNWVAGAMPSPPKPQKYVQVVAAAHAMMKNIHALDNLLKRKTLTKGKESLGSWSPSEVSAEWGEMKILITPAEAKKLTGVSFEFQRGNHRLEVRRVALMGDGKVVAEDIHDGTMGEEHTNANYNLKIPKVFSANNECYLLIEVRTSGGNESYGIIRALNGK